MCTVGKLGPFPNPAHGSAGLVRVQSGRTVESHIAWGYFITAETEAQGKKKETDRVRFSHSPAGSGVLSLPGILREESRFEINLAETRGFRVAPRCTTGHLRAR